MQNCKVGESVALRAWLAKIKCFWGLAFAWGFIIPYFTLENAFCWVGVLCVLELPDFKFMLLKHIYTNTIFVSLSKC